MVSGDFPPAVTGVGDYTRRLVDVLASAGTRVHMFTGAPPGRAASASDWGLGVMPRILSSIDRLEHPILVHIQYPALAYGRLPAINLLPALVKLVRPRCKVVLTVHEFRSMRRRWRLRVVPMLRAADAVVVPDELDAPLVARWTRRSARTVAIPIGPNILPVAMDAAARQAWRAELGLPGADPIVVFFGGVYEHKGVLELISAVQGLRAGATPVRLLIVGTPDPGGQFAAQVNQLVQGDNARWARWLPEASPEVVSRCLAAADLAALPFHSGAMTNRASLLVALAHGVPAVTTRTQATPGWFGRETGMALVPPRDPSKLQECLLDLLRNPTLRDELRRGALAYASTFSWEAVGRQTLDLYRSLAGQEVRLLSGTVAGPVGRSR